MRVASRSQRRHEQAGGQHRRAAVAGFVRRLAEPGDRLLDALEETWQVGFADVADDLQAPAPSLDDGRQARTQQARTGGHHALDHLAGVGVRDEAIEVERDGLQLGELARQRVEVVGDLALRVVELRVVDRQGGEAADTARQPQLLRREPARALVVEQLDDPDDATAHPQRQADLGAMPAGDEELALHLAEAHVVGVGDHHGLARAHDLAARDELVEVAHAGRAGLLDESLVLESHQQGAARARWARAGRCRRRPSVARRRVA